MSLTANKEKITATFIVVGDKESVRKWHLDAVQETAMLARKYVIALVGGSTTFEPYVEENEC